MASGDVVDLVKSSGEGNDYNAAVGWSPAKRGRDIDLDLFGLALGANRKLLHSDFQIDFRHKKSPKNRDTRRRAMHHGGDNLTGRGTGDKETLELLLDDLPAEAWHVVVGLFSYSGQRFGEVSDAYVRVYRPNNRGLNLAYYDLSSGSNYDHTHANEFTDARAVQFGLFSRAAAGSNNWSFTAGGGAYASGRDLYAVYGANGV